MRNTHTVLAAIAAVAAFGLAGCEVEKTSDGDVTLPNYEVTKTQEGNIDVPTYEVRTPDVKVEEKKVEVTVPTIDVQTPAEQRAEGRN